MNIWDIIIIILIIIVIGLIITGIVFAILNKDKKYNTTNVDWLKNVDDNISIKDLIIPGTHDSCTYKIQGVLAPFGKTNDLDITQQLNIGVRFLDLRCALTSDNKFDMHHTIIDLKLSLDEVLDDCKKFLDNNPSEFIILSIKQEQTNSSDFSNIMDTFINDTQQSNKYNWFLESRIPTLNEVRNKFLLLARYDSQYGINTHNWKDNSISVTTSTPPTAIQDIYNTNMNNKLDNIKKFNEDYKDFHDGLKINFTSIQTQIMISIKDIAYLINNNIKDYKFNNSIVVFDYPTADLLDNIIKLNNLVNN